MRYEKRWEKVGEPLGEGGQGVVYRVRDNSRVPGAAELERKLRAALRGINGTGYPEQRRQAFYDLRECIQDIQKADEPQNLGALKLLHKAEHARDPERAEERFRREITAMSETRHPNLLRILEHDATCHSTHIAQPSGPSRVLGW